MRITLFSPIPHVKLELEFPFLGSAASTILRLKIQVTKFAMMISGSPKGNSCFEESNARFLLLSKSTVNLSVYLAARQLYSVLNC